MPCVKTDQNDRVKTSDTHTDGTSFPELQLEVHCAAEEGMRAKGQKEGEMAESASAAQTPCNCTSEAS